MKEHTSWGHHLEVRVDFWVKQRKDHHLLEGLDVVVQTSDLVKVHSIADSQGVRISWLTSTHRNDISA